MFSAMRPRYHCSHRFVCEALYPLTPHSLDFDFEYSPKDRNGNSIELSLRDKQQWRYRTAARAGKFAPIHPPTLTQNPKLCTLSAPRISFGRLRKGVRCGVWVGGEAPRAVFSAIYPEQAHDVFRGGDAGAPEDGVMQPRIEPRATTACINPSSEL